MAPAMNPRTVCFCQHIFCMISVRVAPPLRCSIATIWAVLLPSRGAAASCGFAAFLPWGGFLAAVAFWPVFALAGAPLAPDPVFCMHHAEIDRICAQWQDANPG